MPRATISTLDRGGVYPMPFFLEPKVADVGRSTEWYAGVLGFRAILVMRHTGSGKPLASRIRRS